MTVYPSPFLPSTFAQSKLTFDVPTASSTIDEGGNRVTPTTKVTLLFVLDSPKTRRALKPGEASDRSTTVLEGFCLGELPKEVIEGMLCTREIEGKIQTLRLTSIEVDSVIGAVNSFGVACSFEVLTSSQWGNKRLG